MSVTSAVTPATTGLSSQTGYLAILFILFTAREPLQPPVSSLQPNLILSNSSLFPNGDKTDDRMNRTDSMKGAVSSVRPKSKIPNPKFRSRLLPLGPAPSKIPVPLPPVWSRHLLPLRDQPGPNRTHRVPPGPKHYFFPGPTGQPVKETVNLRCADLHLDALCTVAGRPG